MAVTFDGLPFVDARADAGVLLADAETGTAELVRVLGFHGAPATAFVDEGQLDSSEHAGRTALLQQWVDAGAVLGSHAVARADLNTLTIEAFEDRISRAGTVTRRLMQPRVPYSLYFRYPYAHTGDTEAKKAAIEKFLAALGYRIAPHTIESMDDLFNAEYAKAIDMDDPALMARLLNVYVDFVLSATQAAEDAAQQIFKRRIPQILRLHANDINSDALHQLLSRFEARGYQFVTLDTAMADGANQTKDTFVTAEGPTWLSRWAKSLAVTLTVADAPAPPQWVLDLGRPR